MDARHPVIERSGSGSNWFKGGLYFFLIILPSFVIGYFSYVNLQNQLDQSVFARETAMAALSASVIEERLNHITQLGVTFTNKITVTELIKAGKWEEAIEILQEIRPYSQNVDRIFLVDTTGTILAESPVLPGVKGQNYAHRELFQRLKRNRWQPGISNVQVRVYPPYFNVINSAFGIKDKNGTVLGLLVFQMHLEQFRIWNNQKSLEKGENIYIVDRKGQVVVGTNVSARHGILDYSSLVAVRKALQGKQGVERLYNPLKKTEMLTAYAPVNSFGWGVVVEQPYRLAFAQRDKSLAGLLLIFGFVFLLNCLFAYLVLHNISKLRQTRESLRESEERYSLAFEGTNAGLWDWDLRTNDLFLSPQWKSMMGYTEAEFPNTFEAWTNKLPPDDWKKTMAVIQDYLDKKIPVYDVEFRMLHKDGSYRWILSRGKALWNQEGKPYRMVGSLTDLTERKRLEESLRESEERYALSLEGSNDGLWDWNVRTNEVFFSARWKSMIGYAEEEFPNNFEALQNHLHPDDLDKARANLHAYLDKKIPVYVAEFRMRHKDGTYRWILARGMALWDEEGKPYRMIGSHTDLTERKKLEEENFETRNFLDSVLENMPVMFFMKEAKELRFFRWNKANQELIGYSQEDVIGKNDYDIFPKDQADFFTAKDRAVLESRKLMDIPEESVETRFKGTRLLHTKKIPILDQAGNPIYLLGISEDITGQEAEAKILDLNEQLAHQVAQLEKTNQELKDVTHIISHDLKAPLRGIEMLAEWLQVDCADNLNETCRNHVKVMNERVKRMHNLIEGILRYAHIGRTTGEIEDLDLNKLVPEIADLIAPPANISITLKNTLPHLEAERAPIAQLFQNLMSNAVKYMDKPQGLVKVGAIEEEKHWHFYVADNGPGIEEEYFQRIFQIFQTLQARDEFESTGIGLTIVKKIVETFGGTIWVTSELGKGTTFHFTLPKEMVMAAGTENP